MTSTEVALPDELLNPISGELVPTRDTAAVAHTLLDLRDYKAAVQDAISAFSEAVIQESRRQGTKTLNVGDVTLKVSADSEVVWDHEFLMDALRAAGLPEERIDELVTMTVTYTVNGSVARQLAGASPEYAEVIEAAKSRVPKKVYVSVS